MKSKTTTLASIFLIASTMFVCASDKRVTLDEAPRTIQKAIKEHAGSGKIMRIEKATEQRQVQYEALIKREPSGSEIEFIFNPDGSLDSTEEPLSIKELPVTVQRASKIVVGKGNISTAERRIKGGTITYEVGYRSSKGQEREAVFASDGKLIKNEADTN
jgi:uncharacterized lipoprotein NlpE involved in copper resistance